MLACTATGTRREPASGRLAGARLGKLHKHVNRRFGLELSHGTAFKTIRLNPEYRGFVGCFSENIGAFVLHPTTQINVPER